MSKAGIWFLMASCFTALVLTSRATEKKTIPKASKASEESFDDLMAALDVVMDEPEATVLPKRKAEIEQWIKQLGAAKFRDREAAETSLKQVRDTEYSILEKHLDVKDPEVRVRLKNILQAKTNKNRFQPIQFADDVFFDDPFSFDDPFEFE